MVAFFHLFVRPFRFIYRYVSSFLISEADINFLMQRALEKVAFLPFGYLIDKRIKNMKTLCIDLIRTF
jgi:hypothetical protein